MAIHVAGLDVKRFRGIKDLSLQNLNHINIIAGDNNSGKTSILEAIHLLKDPAGLYNLFRTAVMRENGKLISVLSFFDSFLNMLPKDSYEIEIEAYGDKVGEIVIELKGEIREILLDKKSLSSLMQKRVAKYDIAEIETTAYIGLYECAIDNNVVKYPIEFTSYTEFTRLPRSKYDTINISYLAPSRHLTGNNIDNIVKSPSYKDLCIYLLKLFDEDIEDVLYTKHDLYNKPIENIMHKTLGIMPLSTYGDGIKKVISLANGIASAKDGILMIDEVETSIHKKYYKDIFAFLIKACQQYNVQLFLTTHNQEAMDTFLDIQDYIGDKHIEDRLSVITFRNDKDSGKTLSRILQGNEVKRNRDNFNFEVFI